MSYFLFFPSGFLWEISKTHIALTTHSWFFPEKVFHVSYPKCNTNNMSSHFLIISHWVFTGVLAAYHFILLLIFFLKGFWGVIFMSYLQYFFPLGFLMWYQWHSDLFKSQINMLFSPYFPIRFTGVFMAYHTFLRFFP